MPGLHRKYRIYIVDCFEPDRGYNVKVCTTLHNFIAGFPKYPSDILQ